MSYTRFVAIGDSLTEGLDDPLPDGSYRGWADLFAQALGAANPGARYANLAVRGHRTHQMRTVQLQAALDLQPDLVSLAVSMNDLLRPKLDWEQLRDDLETMVAGLSGAGATVLTSTLPDPSRRVPLARPLRSRLARINDLTRQVADRYGARLYDCAQDPSADDEAHWCPDRIHPGPHGHTWIAAGLARLLGLPPPVLGTPAAGTDGAGATASGWSLVAELQWARTYAWPWVQHRITGRSSGDGRKPKRPVLEPIT